MNAFTVRGGVVAAILTGWAAAANATTTELSAVAQLDMRGAHACVVTTGGGVKCWGSNSSGQLGAGPLGSSRSNATDVTGLTSGVASVATSTGAHTCAVMNDGSVKCWGLNASGQLGDGTSTDRPTPVDVQGLPFLAVAVSAGHYHTCALSAAGAVACWGLNSSGQLGDGTTTQRLAPTAVTGVTGATAISAALYHTCAIVPAGAVKCWGYNSSGQLGDGTTTSSSTPVDVVGVTGATQLATSGDPGAPGPQFYPASGQSCAIVAGVAKCWSNQGVADAGHAAGITSFSRGVGTVHILMASKLYVDHSCVVTAAGGAQCRGINFCGLLGNGTVPSCSNMFNYPYEPAGDVVGLTSGVVSVSAAPFNNCALLASGQVKCWAGPAPVTMLEGTSPQTIVFYSSGSPTVQVGGTGSLASVVATSGGSGNPVVFSSLTPSTCSVSGSVVTGVAGGTCTIAANQAGNAYYDPATEATLSFPIDPHLAQSITFGPAPALVVNGVGSVTATSTSGLPVTFSVASFEADCSIAGNVVTGLREATGLDSCTVTANQAGNSTYAPAQATLEIPVNANTGTVGLVVYKSGGGSGTVTSSVPGINCGLSCAGNFATSSVVTLTAVAGAGSHFDAWVGPCSGTGPCVVTVDALKAVNAHFASDTPRPINLSTRVNVGFGNDAMIGGFVIGGPGNKRVAIIASGPSLSAFGIPNPLLNPTLTLVRSSDQVTIATNDNWAQTGFQPSNNSAELTALGLAPAHVNEAAILIDLAPGAYTAIVGGGTGVAVVGVYEIDAAAAPIINISTRGRVLTGNDVMIGGFVIEGSGPQTVAIVATGPSLTQYGVANALANPALTLVRSSDQTVIATNDDWQSHANAAQLQAAGFAPSNPLESGIFITLQPGAYTAIVQGVGGGTGVAVIGVYKTN